MQEGKSICFLTGLPVTQTFFLHTVHVTCTESMLHCCDSDPGGYEQEQIVARLRSMILAGGMQDSAPLCRSYRSSEADSENVFPPH